MGCSQSNAVDTVDDADLVQREHHSPEGSAFDVHGGGQEYEQDPHECRLLTPRSIVQCNTHVTPKPGLGELPQTLAQSSCESHRSAPSPTRLASVSFVSVAVRTSSIRSLGPLGESNPTTASASSLERRCSSDDATPDDTTPRRRQHHPLLPTSFMSSLETSTSFTSPTAGVLHHGCPPPLGGMEPFQLPSPVIPAPRPWSHHQHKQCDRHRPPTPRLLFSSSVRSRLAHAHPSQDGGLPQFLGSADRETFEAHEVDVLTSSALLHGRKRGAQGGSSAAVTFSREALVFENDVLGEGVHEEAEDLVMMQEGTSAPPARTASTPSAVTSIPAAALVPLMNMDSSFASQRAISRRARESL